MNLNDYVTIKFNLYGEDVDDAGMYISSIKREISRIWQKCSGFTNEDVTLEDMSDFDELLNFLQSVGFFIPPEFIFETDEDRLKFTRMIFDLFLNIFPIFYDQIYSTNKVNLLIEYLDELNLEEAIKFIQFQSPKVIASMLRSYELEE